MNELITCRDHETKGSQTGPFGRPAEEARVGQDGHGGGEGNRSPLYTTCPSFLVK
jgi:hypothetical protein